MRSLENMDHYMVKAVRHEFCTSINEKAELFTVFDGEDDFRTRIDIIEILV